MNCSRSLVEGYLDEELDTSVSAEVEAHLAACQNCFAAFERISEQRADIRSVCPYYAAPAELEQSIREALRQAAAERTEAPDRNSPWRWVAIAASVLLVVSLTWNLSQLVSHTPERDIIAHNVLSSHVRSLIGNHLLDVTSSDQHTVKPWFNGKLDFSPEVKDFASQGFPLTGGRIEYLSDRPVAALIYLRRQHVINVFTWPSTSSDSRESHFARNGYNVVQWSNASMTYWAVSDIPSAEVEQFKELWMK
jgi:anti-sigma factor RsiW